MPKLHVEVFDLFTGDSLLPLSLQASAAPATRRLAGSGSCAFEFRLADLADQGISKNDARDLFRSRARFIAVHDGNTTVPYAGIIMKRKPSPDKVGAITLDTNEFRLATSWRQQSGVHNVQDGDLFATARSATGALRVILQRMLNGPASWQFPLDWAALDEGAGPYDVDAPWYDTLLTEDLIQNLEDRGLEVDFNPYRTASGQLRIMPRIAPVITSGASDFSVTAIKSKITNLAPVEDSTRQVTGVLGAGTGSGSDTVFEWAGNAGSTGIAIADVRRDFADIYDRTALVQATAAELARYADPIEQWALTIDLDDAGLGWEHVAIGRQLKLDIRRHWWIPDGLYTKRIIAASTGLTGKVTLEVQ